LCRSITLLSRSLVPMESSSAIFGYPVALVMAPAKFALRPGVAVFRCLAQFVQGHGLHVRVTGCATHKDRLT
jgi:hypothetical protein